MSCASPVRALYELPDDPLPLPWCRYPTARDVSRHGLQPLPASLPLVDFEASRAHRSRRHATVVAGTLPCDRVLELARVVGTSFARREPQCRHVRPAASAPAVLLAARHVDPFGSEEFGPWTTESLLYWFVRLLVLTDPTSPREAIAPNVHALSQSLAIVDETGRVVGGALNEPMAAGEPPAFRAGDPFLAAMLAWCAPILELLSAQDAEGVEALSARYPEFRAAHEASRIGHHFMVARSDDLAKADTFELVAGTAERYRELGYAYVLVEATNQWTGAACEALGGVRVHFAPFRTRRVVRASVVPVEGEASSVDGFVAGKDSGSMLYVLRVA